MNSFLQSSKFKYLLAGGLTFISEYAVFTALIYATSMLLVSNSLSFVFGLIVSFLLHKFWTFKGEQGVATKSQAIGYILLASINLFIINILIFSAVAYINIDPLAAKVIVMCAVIVWNYLIFNKILFKASN